MEEPGQVSLFRNNGTRTLIFHGKNHQKRLTTPLEQLGTSSRTPTSTESATSQPLALPAPSEPSRGSATASLYKHHHIQFSKQVIPRKTTRKRAPATLQQWRTPKGTKRFWRQILFHVRCHRVSLQGLMEVIEKDSQRIKRGKSVRKKFRFTFRPLL